MLRYELHGPFDIHVRASSDLSALVSISTIRGELDRSKFRLIFRLIILLIDPSHLNTTTLIPLDLGCTIRWAGIVKLVGQVSGTKLLFLTWVSTRTEPYLLT